jgi:hypothetical protein
LWSGVFGNADGPMRRTRATRVWRLFEMHELLDIELELKEWETLLYDRSAGIGDPDACFAALAYRDFAAAK